LMGLILSACSNGAGGLAAREINELNDGSQHGEMGPIADGSDPEELELLIGEADNANPLPPKNVPLNPYLAESGGVHVDSYNTDVSDYGGPLGRDPELVSRSLGEPVGICFMRAFHPDGTMSSTCYYYQDVNLAAQTVTLGIDLILFDPVTLAALDFYAVGEIETGIPGAGADEGVNLSGVYFYIDQQGRAVAASPGNTIRIVEPGESAGSLRWQSEIVLDLSAQIPADGGSLVALGPDYHGNIWFITRAGVIGYLEADSDQAHLI